MKGAALKAVLMDSQEPAICWFEYPLYRYHKRYGTAFVLMTLRCCRELP